MINVSRAAVAFALAASFTACGTVNAIPPTSQSTLNTATLNGSPGFVSSNRLTVYTFDADNATPGVSQCSGACTGVWPPLAPPAGTPIVAPFSVITRSDGSRQVAYSGRPLYTYSGDRKPGDTFGDKLVQFGAEWDIARPGPQSLN
jgi:predicted lipoprotein with Yx(FWY)xxD motif